MNPEEREQLADRWLDAGLKELGCAEPRFGLESRVLARLETEAAPVRNWKWWPAFAVAAVLLVGGVVFFEQHRPEGKLDVEVSTTEKGGPTPTANADVPGTPPPLAAHSRPRLAGKNLAGGGHIAAADPKLDQFPSPQPLSEQEKLLAQYVEERPQEAMVVARMRAELLKQDMRAFEARPAPPQESQETTQ